jgi:hypothetical protein
VRTGDLVELRHPLVHNASIRVTSYDQVGWAGDSFPAGTLAMVLEVHDTHPREGHSMESYAVIAVEGNKGYVYCYECRVVGEQSNATG